MPKQYQEVYRRHLPHIIPLHGIYHVTFRLKNSIHPLKIKQFTDDFDKQKSIIQSTPYSLSERKNALNVLYFNHYENFENELHRNSIKTLSDITKASIVKSALFHFDGKRYQLICFSIMPNHVHVIFKDVLKNVSEIMKSIKGYTAFEINKIDSNKGIFWQDENYDHLIKSRNELADTIKYILNNPVKSNICKHFSEHPFTWCNEKYLEM